MDNLFWLQKDKKTFNLLEKPFVSEEEFEKKIFTNREILEDLFLLNRQARGGSKSGIPDIIGVDGDGKVCIIEMKNVETDSSIIPQVLSYALWAEKNPDSIKTLLLEYPDLPEDVEVDWDDYQVRIIIIAPKIDPSTLEAVDKINYDVDLIEIKRWIEDSNEFLLVNKMEASEHKRITPVRGLRTYDKEFYEKHHNKNSVQTYLEMADEIKNIVEENSWPLERKFNRYYCGFKYGFFVSFGIKWLGSKSFAIFFKIPKDVAEKNQPDDWKIEKYRDHRREAIYKVEPSSKVRDLLPLFQKSMDHIREKDS